MPGVMNGRARPVTGKRGDAGGRRAPAVRSRPGQEERGRTPRARERVEEIQRVRLLRAMGEAVVEGGLAGATIAHVVDRAGVSRRTFYELFEDRGACFCAAFDRAVQQASQSVVPAYESGGSRWREKVRAGLFELLSFLEAEPELGALCVVHVLGAGEPVLRRRAEVLRRLVAVVDEGRSEARPGS